MVKDGKNVDSYAVFANIILYIAIFFKNLFKGIVQKMSIEGASDFRVKKNNFLS